MSMMVWGSGSSSKDLYQFNTSKGKLVEVPECEDYEKTRRNNHDDSKNPFRFKTEGGN